MIFMRRDRSAEPTIASTRAIPRSCGARNYLQGVPRLRQSPSSHSYIVPDLQTVEAWLTSSPSAGACSRKRNNGGTTAYETK
jgi:hypothetical protein